MTARCIFLGFAAWLLAACPPAAPARAEVELPTYYALPVETPHASVSVIGERERPAATAGEALTLGVRFVLEPHWHVYWQNPGDSGEAPRLRWTLPDGWSAGEVRWPAPTRIAAGPLINYGYEGEVVLPVELTPPPEAAGATATVTLGLTWLVCREDCIPGKHVFELPIAARPTGSPPAAVDPTWGPVFAGLREARPPPTPARFAADGAGPLRLYLPEMTAPEGAAVHILAAEEGVVPPTAEVGVARPAEGGLLLTVEPADTAPDPLTTLSGLIQIDGQPTSSRAFEARAGAVPTAAAPPAATPLPDEQTSLGLAVLFALLGGLLLNLMPCVFPVLSLKVLAFVEHAADDHRAIRRQGWLFTAGVLVSFWALAGALIALRAGGEQLGWGFQLQSPGFVAALAVLMFGLALSLAGVFEVGLSLTAIGGRGEWGAFGTGVLATVVATPCTAPFMGPALGFALTRSPAESLAVFTALGGGMALPYLVLAHAPGLLRRLPRPGGWMTTFKQLMAFPLFATVLWLVDVFLQQTSVAAAGALLVALLALAFAGWLWGRLQYGGRTGPAWVVVALLVAAPGVWLAHGAVTFDDAAPGEALWQPWSAEAEARLRAEGTPVFVNFTAAWCISCKVNERVVFDRDDVRAAFARNGVVPLLADWTDRDDEIGRTLENYGRQGVPLYLYHAPGAPRPTVLPSVLTPDMVIAALDGAVDD